jgi:hypothetical protein
MRKKASRWRAARLKPNAAEKIRERMAYDNLNSGGERHFLPDVKGDEKSMNGSAAGGRLGRFQSRETFIPVFTFSNSQK